MRYAIRCTPGGLLKDDASGNVIDFATYDRIWRQFFRPPCQLAPELFGDAALIASLALAQLPVMDQRVDNPFERRVGELDRIDPLAVAAGVTGASARAERGCGAASFATLPDYRPGAPRSLRIFLVATTATLER